MNNFNISCSADSIIRQYSKKFDTFYFKDLNDTYSSINILIISKKVEEVFLKTRGEEIGSGNFGTVYKINNCHGRVYKFIDFEETGEIIKECQEVVVAKIASQNGVGPKFFGACVGSGYLCIEMGYVKGYSLEEIIDPEEDGGIENQQNNYEKIKAEIYNMFLGKENYYLDIFKQIKKLNDSSIFYPDLHFGNIMVTNNEENKNSTLLIDFGGSIVCTNKREACIYQLSNIFPDNKVFLGLFNCSDWSEFFKLESPSQESNELTKFFFGTVGELSFKCINKELELYEKLKKPINKMKKAIVDGISVNAIYTGEFKKAHAPLAKLLYQDFLRFNDQEKKDRGHLIRALKEADKDLLLEKLQNIGNILELSPEIFYSTVREIITEKYDRLSESIQAKVNDLYFNNLQMDPLGLEALGIEPLKWDPMGLKALGLGDIGSEDSSSLKSALGEPDKINLALLADVMHYYEVE